MTIEEYGKIKHMSYNDYCEYLTLKYGKLVANYGSSKNKKSNQGLFIHHIKEDVVSSLSNRIIAKENDPSYQCPENLVYCNYLEHLLLHILIGEKTAGDKNIGLDGAFRYIIPALINFFNFGIRNTKINENYYNVIVDYKNTFDALLDRYNKLIKDVDILLDHNITLYQQMENLLCENNKALVVLGTGLGKTTTALHYLKQNNCRALVICPNNTVKKNWDECFEYCDTITYSAFSKKYSTIDYSIYGIVVLDEAHHAGFDEDSKVGAEVWAKGIKWVVENNIKVLGLTATPVRSDGIDVGNSVFLNCVCEGLAVEEAIEQGIVYPFSYISAIYDTDSIIEEYKDLDNKTLVGQLDLSINNTPTVRDILTTKMPSGNRKGIVFIQEIEDEQYVREIISDVFKDVDVRTIHSKQDDATNEENRKWFQDTESGYLIAINMISEGAHYKGVNTLIMFRRTSSYMLYTQQLGRIITLTTKENPNAIVFDLVNNVNNVEYNDRKLDKNEKHSVSKTIQAIKTAAEKSSQVIIEDYTVDIVKAIKDIKDYEDDSWEDWEIEIIKRYYEEEGPSGCQRRIDEEWERRYPGSLTN